MGREAEKEASFECGHRHWRAYEDRLWDFLSGGDGVRWTQILNDFNASQNKLVVDHTTLTWGDPFYTKVHTAVVAGQTPDVYAYHLSHFPPALSLETCVRY